MFLREEHVSTQGFSCSGSGAFIPSQQYNCYDSNNNANKHRCIGYEISDEKLRNSKPV